MKKIITNFDTLRKYIPVGLDWFANCEPKNYHIMVEIRYDTSWSITKWWDITISVTNFCNIILRKKFILTPNYDSHEAVINEAVAIYNKIIPFITLDELKSLGFE